MRYTDRRRFILAAVVTLIAIPAIWWAFQNRDSDSSDVATTDVAIEGDAAVAGSMSPLTPEPVGDYEPVYLDGPEGDALPGIADIAVPAPGKLAVYQSATYSSALPVGICVAKGATAGERVNVVNLENNRSITCVVQWAPPEQEEDLILSRGSFLKLADLTDAPIPVELRQ